MQFSKAEKIFYIENQQLDFVKGRLRDQKALVCCPTPFTHG